jgi:tRNA threonylcarbamoyladenosine biosynthesis protein TsaB
MYDGDGVYREEWQADRQLAKGLLQWIDTCLSEHGYQWGDIASLGAYRGPGSFTGLRIGLTVMNTLAESLAIPIVGATGEQWEQQLMRRLENNENDKLLLPFYDRDATITSQRK